MAKISLFQKDSHTVAILGSNGKLGGRFLKILHSKGYQEKYSLNIKFNSNSFSDLHSTLLSIATGSSVLINCIGLVGIEACSRNIDLANLLNSQVPLILSSITRESGAKLLHMSTPSVFTGKSAPNSELDIPDALSVYGQSKANGDNFVLMSDPNALVARINFVGIFDSLENIGSKFVYHAMRDEKVTAFTNSFFSPTHVDLVTKVALEMVEVGDSGLFHLNSPQRLSKYEFAQEIYRESGRDISLVTPETFDNRGYHFSPDTSMKSTRRSNKELFLNITELSRVLISEFLSKASRGE